ncbi:MAG: alpha/beta fold hydrolase [Solirubrobacteraceae bacterium]
MNIKKGLKHLTINNFTTYNKIKIEKLNVFYEVFGDINKLQENGVLVCHALTGDSNVAGENGWWKDFVGQGKTIDINKQPVIAFNIPGNGYDGMQENLFSNYQQFNIRDIATIFLLALKELGIKKLDTVIGGSLGGGIAWELIVQEPIFFKKAIIVGAHYQSTDWVIGHNYIQLEILKNNHKPLEIARMMAMLFYRTPESFELKFNRQKLDEKTFQIENYLNYQGEKLKNRYKIEAYSLMTNLLSKIDILESRGELNEVVKNIKTKVILVGIENDYLFQKEYNIYSIPLLKEAGMNIEYRELKSIHGHDAFLIEIERMHKLLKDLF